MPFFKGLKRRLKNLRNRGATSSASSLKKRTDINPELQCEADLTLEPENEQHTLSTSAIAKPSDMSVEPQAQDSSGTGPTRQLVDGVSIQQRLWNVAYDSLEEDKDTKELVHAYINTLGKVLGAEPRIDDISAEDMKDPYKRQSLMAKLVKDGRAKIENGSKVTKGVARIAEKVLSFKPMVDLLVQSINQSIPAALPWAGVCAVLQILSNPAKASNWNLDGITRIVSTMDLYCTLGDRLLDAKDPNDPNDAVLHQLEQRVTTLYKALLRYQMESVCSYYRSHGLIWLRGLVLLDDWNGYLKDVTDAEENLMKANELYKIVRDGERWHELLGQGEKVQSILGDTHQTLQSFVDQQKTSHRLDKDNECLRRLCLVDPHDYMEKIQKSKDTLLTGVYDWILSTDEYAAFTNWGDIDTAPSGSLMWVKGHAGTGKTMLLMGIIRQLSHQPVTYTPSVSHFFCQGNNKALSSVTAILRSLIWLLLIQQPHLLHHLTSKYEMTGSSLFDGDAAFISLSNVFKGILEDQDLWPVIFIVDALDECEQDRKELLDLINDSLNLSKKVKWLVSSRPAVHLNTTGIGRHLIELDTQKLQRPVKTFIHHKLSRLRDRDGYNPNILDKIEEEVSRRAENTFLWVALAFKELDREDANSIKLHGKWAIEAIQKIPPGLSKLYAHILTNIGMGLYRDPQYCKAVLASAVLAYRPLTPSELAIAAGLPDDMDPITIVRKCGSFLTIEDESVKLIHQSAIDFLLEEASNDIFPLGLENMHHSIFLRSLQVMEKTLQRDIYGLRVPGYSIHHVQTPDPDPLAAARYSCIHWVDHLCDSSYSSVLNIDLKNDRGLFDFLQHKFLQWLEALSLMREIPAGVKAMEKLEGVAMSNIQEAQELVKDARLFILSHKGGIEVAPLQVYASALIFSPTKSLIKQAFNKEYPTWMELSPDVQTDWNACLQTIEAHNELIHSVAFSFDGAQVASGSGDEVKIWDTTSGHCLQILKDHDVSTNSVSFSPHNQKLVSGSSDSKVKIWDATSGKCLHKFEGHGDSVTSVSFSNNGQRVVSGSKDKTIRIWNATSGECLRILEGHHDSVNSVSFSADDEQVVSGSSDHKIKIWDGTSGDCLRTFMGHGGSVNSVVFIPGASQVASGSDDTSVKIWDIASGNCILSLEEHTQDVVSVSTSMSGQRIASGSRDAKVKIWDVTSGKCVNTFVCHGYVVTSIAFSRDGRRLASAIGDCSIKIWDTAPGNYLTAPEGDGCWENTVAFSLDGQRIVSGSDDGTIRIWNATSGDRLHRLEASRGWVTSVAFSMDGRRIVSGPSTGEVIIWDAISGEQLQILEGDGGYSESVAFARNNQRVASGTRDNIVRIWDTASGKHERTLEGHHDWINSVAFSSDSQRVISGSTDKTVRIWDVTSGNCLRILEGHPDHVRSVCFSPNDKQVVSSSRNTLMTWDAITGSCVQTISMEFALQFLSFDTEIKSRLFTDRGYFTLEVSFPFQDYHDCKRHGFGIGADGTWIIHDDNNLFWLPPDYRSVQSKIVGRTIAIGTASGRVLIMRLAPNAGCA